MAGRRPVTRPNPGYDASAVPRNSKGGVLVTDEELAAAFRFFDIDGSGKITITNLRKRLGVFYKSMPHKDYKFLMGDRKELTLQDLRDLLLENEVTNFDPVAEAFKVYDPHDTKFVDVEVLREMFQNLGFGEVTDEDLQILIETGDVDRDGKISLQDFRTMLDFNRQAPPAAEGEEPLELDDPLQDGEGPEGEEGGAAAAEDVDGGGAADGPPADRE